MIDLHLHTTASDGLLSPSELVARAQQVGLTTISVTDHDTVASLDDAWRHAGAAGISFVPGIEITSVHNGRDVHILGYFIDEGNEPLARFLERQRSQRVERLHEIAGRLAQLGMSIDVERLLSDPALAEGSAIGRPAVARALVESGYVSSIDDAFRELLGTGRPAFVPRRGFAPVAVVDIIHRAGGLASLAHPGLTREPELLETLAREGLDALEAYHTDHTQAMRDDALATAGRLQLAVTGGSDYHGNDARRPIGGVTLPQADFDAFVARRRHAGGQAER
ncbi:MAG TPA: PHP domain-containing protein [Vicinamibacterales bacterium]|nr:PHP domain-containing protein [Vicinamibacterales bacterium]